MDNLKAKSIAFVVIVWAALFGLILYQAYENIGSFIETMPRGPLKLDEILNNNS